MKSNVLPKRMTAHLCRGSNSPWWFRCICGGWYVVGVGGGGGVAGWGWRWGWGGGGGWSGGGGGGGGLQLAWNLTNLSMIQNNDVWSPETYTNDLINSTSAQTICNFSQFQVCRCYGPFICWGTSNTVASHEWRRFILPKIRLFMLHSWYHGCLYSGDTRIIVIWPWIILCSQGNCWVISVCFMACFYQRI